MKKYIYFMSIIVMLGLVVSCIEEASSPVSSNNNSDQTSFAKKSGNATDDAIALMMDDVNAKLISSDKNYVLGVVEYITPDGAEEAGRTVYFRNLGNKQLGSHWVPGDPNRGGGTNISWATDQADNSADVSLATSTAAIERAMQTWQDVQCSTIPLESVSDEGYDLGYVQYLFGMGGVPGWLADLTHAGWLPRAFFDAIGGPTGGDRILGVTFTFIWTDDITGAPTDMDNNGKNDVAFREIYYNDNFVWNDGSTYDIETVALHEAGHGLSQGHFGSAFRTVNGKLHFSPRAVMNAAYSGVQTKIAETDNGGHCSIWGSWPNN